MPNGHGHKEYGKHKYANHDETSDCKHGCGCSMGDFTSGGPTGLDPFGTCPKNPKDGKLLGGSADYDHVVTERIRDLESRLCNAEERLKAVKPRRLSLLINSSLRETSLLRRTGSSLKCGVLLKLTCEILPEQPLDRPAITSRAGLLLFLYFDNHA